MKSKKVENQPKKVLPLFKKYIFGPIAGLFTSNSIESNKEGFLDDAHENHLGQHTENEIVKNTGEVEFVNFPNSRENNQESQFKKRDDDFKLTSNQASLLKETKMSHVERLQAQKSVDIIRER